MKSRKKSAVIEIKEVSNFSVKKIEAKNFN